MNPLAFYAEIPSVAVDTGKELTGTWWGDFRVGAELGGLRGIKDTYKRGLKLAQSDEVLGTEFSLVLNWLSWYYEKDEDKCRLFAELWHKFDNWVLDNWSDEWKDYYLKEID